MDQPVQLGLAAPDGHLQSVQGQVGPQRAGGLPADEEPAERIDHKRHIDKARPGRHIGEIGDPQLVGPGGREVTIDQVRGSRGSRIRRGGPAGLATADTLQAQLAHQPLDGAAGHRDPLTVQLPPHLAGAVDAELLGMDAADLGLELAVTHSPG
jgi:hypothetical protein